MTADRLGWLNALPPADAAAELARCCAAPSWVAVMAAGRPYPDLTALLTASDDAVVRMSSVDLSTALAAHPRIGAAGSTGWSRQEQAGVAGAGPGTAAALETGNRDYEARFGHVFLICATGLGADEMLAALRARLGNDPVTEAKIVREELRKITTVRLRKLVATSGGTVSQTRSEV